MRTLLFSFGTEITALPSGDPLKPFPHLLQVANTLAGRSPDGEVASLQNKVLAHFQPTFPHFCPKTKDFRTSSTIRPFQVVPTKHHLAHPKDLDLWGNLVLDADSVGKGYGQGR